MTLMTRWILEFLERWLSLKDSHMTGFRVNAAVSDLPVDIAAVLCLCGHVLIFTAAPRYGL